MPNLPHVIHTNRLLKRKISAVHFLFPSNLVLPSPLPPPYVATFSGMAAIPENVASDIPTQNVVVHDNLEFGLERKEMYTENLLGSVHPYERHIFLCYNARVESSDSDPLPKRLAGAIKERKNDIAVKTLLSIFERRDLSDGDILIFPDMIKYRGLEESNINSFVEEVLVNGGPWASGTPDVVTGSHVFVCAPPNIRDKRLLVCEPALIEKFNKEIELKGLKDQVFVSLCSHVGCYKYAGNLIIYSAFQDEKVSGHWYGYVIPFDVLELLDQHIKKGEIIERIWRGQMGAPPLEKAEKAVEPTLPNGNDLKVSKKWEKRNIFTAAAVIGAVATVAVAYSLSKRSRKAVHLRKIEEEDGEIKRMKEDIKAREARFRREQEAIHHILQDFAILEAKVNEKQTWIDETKSIFKS